MNPDDKVFAEILGKLFDAGGWPAFLVSLVATAWFWFKGKNVSPEWAEKGDLADLRDEVRHIDTKVDNVIETVHATRETLARIEGLLEGQKR